MTEDTATAPAPEQSSSAAATQNNAAQATEAPNKEPTDATADDARATEGEDKPKRQRDGGFQRRINELTREYRESQRREAEATRRADELLAELRSRSSSAATSAASSDQAPKQEHFASYEDFIDARAKWNVRQEIKAERASHEEARRRESMAAAESQRRETLQSAAKVAAERYADFEDAVAGADIPIPHAMAEAIAAADSGMRPEILYYLARNLDEARTIAAKPMHQQAMEIGRIEERLKAQASRSKAVSEATEPPRTVKGKGIASPDPDRMSMADFMKWRRTSRD